jgi:RNA polymerase sigma factor (sigma-70 family)
MKNPETIANKQNREDTGKLIEEHRPKLRAFVRQHLDNASDVDDVLQDVFYQFVKTVENTLNPIEHVSAWLYKVARNTIINRGKKKREEEFPIYAVEDSDESLLNDFSEMLFNNETSPSPETDYLRSLVWIELENALAELPLEQREVFELTELDGIPVREISITTGVPINTLLSRKHYAVLHLRKRLSDLRDEILYS